MGALAPDAVFRDPRGGFAGTLDDHEIRFVALMASGTDAVTDCGPPLRADAEVLVECEVEWRDPLAVALDVDGLMESLRFHVGSDRRIHRIEGIDWPSADTAHDDAFVLWAHRRKPGVLIRLLLPGSVSGAAEAGGLHVALVEEYVAFLEDHGCSPGEICQAAHRSALDRVADHHASRGVTPPECEVTDAGLYRTRVECGLVGGPGISVFVLDGADRIVSIAEFGRG